MVHEGHKEPDKIIRPRYWDSSALGCTIGQGVTGLSTLAPGSLIAVAAIVAGAIAGLRALERFAG
jgi:hypothetical protein